MKPVHALPALALILCGCQPAGAPAPAAGATATAANTVPLCAEPIRREIAFTKPDAKDVLEVLLVGANCKEASALLTLKTASGELLFTRAEAAGHDPSFYDTNINLAGATAQLVESTKAALKDATVTTTDDSPDWKEGAPRPEEPSGLFIGTEMARDQYLSIRAEKRPKLCHMIFNLRTQCLIFFDGNGGPSYAEQYYDLQS